MKRRKRKVGEQKTKKKVCEKGMVGFAHEGKLASEHRSMQRNKRDTKRDMSNVGKKEERKKKKKGKAQEKKRGCVTGVR
jgi:hypothetical protein